MLPMIETHRQRVKDFFRIDITSFRWAFFWTNSFYLRRSGFWLDIKPPWTLYRLNSIKKIEKVLTNCKISYIFCGDIDWNAKNIIIPSFQRTFLSSNLSSFPWLRRTRWSIWGRRQTRTRRRIAFIIWNWRRRNLSWIKRVREEILTCKATYLKQCSLARVWRWYREF